MECEVRVLETLRIRAKVMRVGRKMRSSVGATVPDAPRPNCTAMNPNSKSQIAPTRDRAPTKTAAKWLAMAPTTPNQSATEKVNAAANVQIKVLTDLVTSLLRAMEDQKK